MRDDGRWWYDQQAANGKRNDPWVNADMISPAFWLVRGNEFKITRSDDPIHTPLLRTTGNCLGGQTFRSKITNCGDFRDFKVWASNQCLWICTVQYGGHVQIIGLGSQKLPLLFSLKVVVKLSMTFVMMPCQVPVHPSPTRWFYGSVKNYNISLFPTQFRTEERWKGWCSLLVTFLSKFHYHTYMKTYISSGVQGRKGGIGWNSPLCFIYIAKISEGFYLK